MASDLGHAWLEASRDLGIRVTAPYSLVLDSGEVLQFDALVHDFGARCGMVLMAKYDPARADVASALGYGYSCLSAESYDRKFAIDCLNDWGWVGSPDARPSWYSPEPEEA